MALEVVGNVGLIEHYTVDVITILIYARLCYSKQIKVKMSINKLSIVICLR